MAFFAVVSPPIHTLITMIRLFKTSIGRLRIIGFLEGISLLLLLFIAVPLKHYAHNPVPVKTLGPVHGALFLLYIFNALNVGVEKQWTFKGTTWKVLVACLIPFGTFYIDHKILALFSKE